MDIVRNGEYFRSFLGRACIRRTNRRTDTWSGRSEAQSFMKLVTLGPVSGALLDKHRNAVKNGLGGAKTSIRRQGVIKAGGLMVCGKRRIFRYIRL